MNKNSFLRLFIFILLLIAILFIIRSPFTILFNWTELQKLNTKDGAYINIANILSNTSGPVIALFAALLTFFAFWVQIEANNQQKEQFKKQQDDTHIERIENKFFQLMSFHRDNVGDVEYSRYYETLGTKSGRKAFTNIYYEFEEIYSLIKPFFLNCNIDEVYMNDYKLEIQKMSKIQNRDFNPIHLSHIDIAYLILYFGVGKKGTKYIITFYANRYKKEFLELVLNHVSLKPQFVKKDTSTNDNKRLEAANKNWERYLELSFYEQKKILVNAMKGSHNRHPTIEHFRQVHSFHNGNQTILGHYYRHLFQTVNFINTDKKLKYPQKYDYIKSLRAQISSYEQMLFFINSLSQLGRNWELEYRPIDSMNMLANINYNENNQLITKYNLIKNIPSNNVIDEIQATHYYPNVAYEVFSDEKIFIQRNELIKSYT